MDSAAVSQRQIVPWNTWEYGGIGAEAHPLGRLAIRTEELPFILDHMWPTLVLEYEIINK